MCVILIYTSIIFIYKYVFPVGPCVGARAAPCGGNPCFSFLASALWEHYSDLSVYGAQWLTTFSDAFLLQPKQAWCTSFLQLPCASAKASCRMNSITHQTNAWSLCLISNERHKANSRSKFQSASKPSDATRCALRLKSGLSTHSSSASMADGDDPWGPHASRIL